MDKTYRSPSFTVYSMFNRFSGPRCDLSGMQILLCCLLVLFSGTVAAQPPPETPQQSLNQYVAFLNQSVDEVTHRFRMLQTYQAGVKQYRETPGSGLGLPSSGPLPDYYYQKARAGTGLTTAEKQRLTAGAQALWQRLTTLDQTGKALETYVRLADYQRDTLHRSDALVGDMRTLLRQFDRDKTAFYQQIRQIYRRYQPYSPADPYLYTENQMEQVLLSQQRLLDLLAYYLDEDSRSDWPAEQVQQSMLADEKLLADFGKARSKIAYPASDMVATFRAAVQAVQAVKRRAIDNNTFAARQSARHGNAVYLALIEQGNQGLLTSHQAFINYSQSARRLLAYPKFSPVVTAELPPATLQTNTPTPPFSDKPPVGFTTKPAASPATRATFLALNAYVDFINESLRQMHYLQQILRNYQSSAEYHREPSRSGQRGDLTYAHDDYKVPRSDYQLLLSTSQHIPLPYRPAINGQAEVLVNMLTEMDGLSIELMAYTTEKQYARDRLARSDALLDRYAVLFDLFDRKKEQLYRDVRRIHESYPVANPASAWHVAGKALLTTLDQDTEILFGVKRYLQLETADIPVTNPLEASARSLIANEYKNLSGLQRFGRSNGLCPYSPYEDLAENSLRFAEKARALRPGVSDANSYETFYYFYNNELVYQYNQFAELAKTGVLKAVNQPDVFAFRRLPPSTASTLPARKTEPPATDPVGSPRPEPPVRPARDAISTGQPTRPAVTVAGRTTSTQDTVYINRTTVDTVYVDRTGEQAVSNTLSGFAPNNMVLLLDVSASMDSPYKMPLLKRSIRALLTLLRPEDQISVVVYSGKARVVLKPTSGARAADIARVIDALESGGDTDGDAGLRLAYKVADKHYIRAGNNRIILATDGEFPVSDGVIELIGERARQDIRLTVFTFGRNPLTGQTLKKLSTRGKGMYTHVTAENAGQQLIREAQAR